MRASSTLSAPLRAGCEGFRRPLQGISGRHHVIHGDAARAEQLECGRFEPALELLRTGCISVDDMVSAEYPLERAPEAFAHAARKGALKVLLTTSAWRS